MTGDIDVALQAVDGGVEENNNDDDDDEQNVELNSKNWGKENNAATKAESSVSLALFLGVQKTLARKGWTTMK